MNQKIITVNYVDYIHSYAHVIQPKLKAINFAANVAHKPVSYVKAIVRNTLTQSGTVHWTDKEQWFFDTAMSQIDATQLYYFCKNACNKAKETFVDVYEESGELVRN